MHPGVTAHLDHHHLRTFFIWRQKRLGISSSPCQPLMRKPSRPFLFSWSAEHRQVILYLSFVTYAKTLFSPSAFHVAWTAHDDRGNIGFSYICKWQDVHDGAENGCSWCKILAKGLLDALEYKTHTADVIAEETFHVTVAFKKRRSLYLNLDVENLIQPYEVHSDPNDIAAKYISEREVMHQIGTDKCFENASEAIRACTALESGHDDCRPALKGKLPTRVIDCLDPDNPKLYVAQPEFEGHYAALSYVWGEDQPNKTTIANISTYTQAIDLSLLPQTIRDALICTKKLGLRYLWVDALCILQDSKEDKRHEISRMRDIFRGAFVTIVAGSASRVSSGFLQDRIPPRPAVRLPFICPCPERFAGTMLLREPRVESLIQDPVNSRAWCLEERLLTPRALIYSTEALQFSYISTDPHALGTSSNAFFVEGIRLPPFMHYPEEESYRRLPPDPEYSFSKVREFMLQNSWNEVVAEYTRRDLTRQKDRLVAIGGVVQEFQKFWVSSRYLAGLWSHRLLDDLLWGKRGSMHPRPKKYRAPSWSWAAVDGQAACVQTTMDTFWPNTCSYLCEVLCCETVLADARYPFGEVIGGVLELRAIIKEMLWSPTTSTLFLLDQGDRKDAITRHADPDCDEEVTRTETKVWAIPLRRLLGSGFNSIEGILVAPVLEPEGTYRRVGSFQIGTAKQLPNFNVQSWLDGSREVVSVV